MRVLKANTTYCGGSLQGHSNKGSGKNNYGINEEHKGTLRKVATIIGGSFVAVTLGGGFSLALVNALANSMMPGSSQIATADILTHIGLLNWIKIAEVQKVLSAALLSAVFTLSVAWRLGVFSIMRLATKVEKYYKGEIPEDEEIRALKKELKKEVLKSRHTFYRKK